MLTTASTATTILANALRALESLREQAQKSKDATLKATIVRFYDELANLKSIVMRVEDENEELRRRLEEQSDDSRKPLIKQVGRVNYYYVGNEGPYCQVCYDSKGKLVTLTPQQEFWAGTGRKCALCTTVFVEIAKSRGRSRIRVQF